MVVDASAVLELLLGGPSAAAVATHIRAADGLHAPELLDLEVVQVLRRFDRAKSLSAARAQTAFLDYRDLNIRRHSHAPFLDRIWMLRANATAYDAAYLALAEGLDAPLLTLDARLAASPTHRARIELV